jgi:hypothetical protein
MAMGKDFTIRSMVGARTGEPAVSFRFGDQHINMPPDAARKVALDLIGCADRAELEANLLAYLRRNGAGDDVVRQTLTLLRDADEEGR